MGDVRTSLVQLTKPTLHCHRNLDRRIDLLLPPSRRPRCRAVCVSFGKLAQPIRVAVSGTTVSPQIIDTLILLGRERTIARIKGCSIQSAS